MDVRLLACIALGASGSSQGATRTAGTACYRLTLLRIATAATLFATLCAGCKPTGGPEPGAMTFVCRKFEFPIEKREWLEVRQLARELSAKMSAMHEFSDTSHQDPVDRRWIHVDMKFSEGRYRLVVGGIIDTDLQPVRIFVFEDTAASRPQPCVRWSQVDYELAKSMFSTRWKVSEVTVEPYDLYRGSK